MINDNLIYQFKISLNYISPKIWRRIQVPATYSFWDLHVALNDAMGWLDYHLHAFYFLLPDKKVVTIGIWDEDSDEKDEYLLDWNVPIVTYFTQIGQLVSYRYDFGDGWEHEILFEGILLKEKRLKYPRCIDGERACPPEDCGGVEGYLNFLEIINNPKHEDYKETIVWLKNHAKNYHPYKPDEFNPQKVRFDDSKKRLQNLLSAPR